MKLAETPVPFMTDALPMLTDGWSILWMAALASHGQPTLPPSLTLVNLV